MANYEATKYDFSGANLTGIQGVNTGIVVPWGDSTVPSGFLECNGQSVSQSTYADLFAVIGTTFGDPGGGNFNVPDLTDRIVVSKSPSKTLASTGGANTVAGAGNVSGTVGNTTIGIPTFASHSHGNAVSGGGGGARANPHSQPDDPVVSGANPGSPGQQVQNTGGGGAHTHSGSLSFTGNATSVLQPYLTVMYIIKT